MIVLFFWDQGSIILFRNEKDLNWKLSDFLKLLFAIYFPLLIQNSVLKPLLKEEITFEREKKKSSLYDLCSVNVVLYMYQSLTLLNDGQLSK